jgi:hypothetical protein
MRRARTTDLSLTPPASRCLPAAPAEDRDFPAACLDGQGGEESVGERGQGDVPIPAGTAAGVRRRTPTRANRLAIRANTGSNSACHRPASATASIPGRRQPPARDTKSHGSAKARPVLRGAPVDSLFECPRRRRASRRSGRDAGFRWRLHTVTGPSCRQPNVPIGPALAARASPFFLGLQHPGKGRPS